MKPRAEQALLKLVAHWATEQTGDREELARGAEFRREFLDAIGSRTPDEADRCHSVMDGLLEFLGSAKGEDQIHRATDALRLHHQDRERAKRIAGEIREHAPDHLFDTMVRIDSETLIRWAKELEALGG